MITSGRFSTLSPSGLYWMSCIRSFSNTTLPGVVATFSPSLNAFSSVIEKGGGEEGVQAAHQVLAAARERLAQHLRGGEQEVRRRARVHCLAGRAGPAL